MGQQGKQGRAKVDFDSELKALFDGAKSQPFKKLEQRGASLRDQVKSPQQFFEIVRTEMNDKTLGTEYSNFPGEWFHPFFRDASEMGNEAFLTGMVGGDIKLWIKELNKELETIEGQIDHRRPHSEQGKISQQMATILPAVAAICYAAKEKLENGELKAEDADLAALKSRLERYSGMYQFPTEQRQEALSPFQPVSMMRYAGWLGSETSRTQALNSLKLYTESPAKFDSQLQIKQAIAAAQTLSDSAVQKSGKAPQAAQKVHELLAKAKANNGISYRVRDAIPYEAAVIGLKATLPGSAVDKKELDRRATYVAKLPVAGRTFVDSRVPNPLRTLLRGQIDEIEQHEHNWHPLWHKSKDINESDRDAAAGTLMMLLGYAGHISEFRRLDPKADIDSVEREALLALREDYGPRLMWNFLQGKLFDQKSDKLTAEGKQDAGRTVDILGFDLANRKVLTSPESIDKGRKILNDLLDVTPR